MKQQALALAGLGMHVFPLTARSKEPFGGSRGHLDASNDPDQIERLWSGSLFANIGINCGASGLYVIDIDMCPWKGKTGQNTWALLVEQHGFVPTYAVRTWSGGLHLYYRMPQGVILRNTTGKGGSTGRGLGAHIDTRGEGGFVVAPGSFVREIDASGLHEGTYTVEQDIPIADLPQWIIDLCADRERAQPVAGPVAAEEAVLERLRTLCSELEAAPDGEGNNTASRVAFWAGQYVGAKQVDADTAIGMLLDAISGWSWRVDADYRSMCATIERGVAEGQQRPRAWDRPVAQQPVVPLVLNSVETILEPVMDEPKTVKDEPADPEKEAERDLSDWATDLGQAHHLASRLAPKVMHADGVGWHCWDGKRWAPVSKDYIANMATRFYRSQFRLMLDKFKDTEEDRYSVLAKAYKSFMGSSRLGNIIKMLSVIDGVFADPTDLDCHPELLNTPSGVVNLRTGLMSPHDPDLLITKVTKGRYRPGYSHPDWAKALTALPPEQADYMQIRMGQAATGDNSKDVMFLVGMGANGKSAYTSEGVFPALGDYAHLAQPTLISKGQGTGATPDRAALRGVRFALIEELPESHALSVEEIKRIADTAVITARMLHANPLTYVASHSLFVTSNTEPAVAEVDHGTWRRLLLMSFPYTFVEKPEADYERQGDPTLKRRIRDGAGGQHDAIVTWLVEGAKRYFDDPMLIEIERRPLEVVEAIEGWKMKADRIMAYFTDRLVIDPDGMVARSDLFADFSMFLTSQAHAKWGSETFLSRFRTHELVRRAGVTEGQTRNHDGLSRPPLPPGVMFSSTTPPLPKVVRMFRGLSFRQETVA